MGKHLEPGRVNASLADISDGPLKEKHSVGLTEKDPEVAESLSREAMVLQSHLLWLMELLEALTRWLDQPNAVAMIQPIMTRVLEHMKWVQALLTDTLTTLATNSILVRRDLTISTLGGQVPKDVMRSLRTSPLLGDLMFHISTEDLEDLKKRRSERYMYSVLCQATQLKTATVSRV